MHAIVKEAVDKSKQNIMYLPHKSSALEVGRLLRRLRRLGKFSA
jgi:hypothetical protein